MTSVNNYVDVIHSLVSEVPYDLRAKSSIGKAGLKNLGTSNNMFHS